MTHTGQRSNYTAVKNRDQRSCSVQRSCLHNIKYYYDSVELKYNTMRGVQLFTGLDWWTTGLDWWTTGLDWTTGLKFLVVTQSAGAKGVICIGSNAPT
jgi:hypothetical protein